MPAPVAIRVLAATAVMTFAAGCHSSQRVVAVRQFDGSMSTDGQAGRFGAPRLIPGLLDETDALQDPSLTADELEIYFSTAKLGTIDIWRSTRTSVAAPWARAARVEELSTVDRDLEPEVSSDGLTIYFSRDPIVVDPDFRVFVSQRATRTSPWESPQLVALGPPDTDRGPAVDRRGLNLAFASLRAGGEFDLYLAHRPDAAAAWDDPFPLTELNSPGPDWDPGLFLDSLGLVFGSRRDQSSTSDLFETSRPTESTAFVAPTHLTELNSPMSEGDPWLSNDGRHIVYTSDRDGTSRLYEAWR